MKMKRFILLPAVVMFHVVNAQIENGMIAHFPFNSNVSDISTSAIVATNNGCSYTNDRNGAANGAINFNNSGYVSLAGDDLKVSFPISVSFWVKLNSISEVNIMFKTDNVYSNYYGIWMNTLPTGGMTLSFGGGLGTVSSSNARYFTTSDNFITAGTWHHVVGIIRSYNDMDIYIDCNKANGTYGGTGQTTMSYSTTGSTRIGGSIGNTIHPDDFYADGMMDQFAFWDRELTVPEIHFLCDTNNPLSVADKTPSATPEIIKIVDMLGRETDLKPNVPLIYIYSDGTKKQVVQVEN